MEFGLLFISLACVIGFAMTWSVGANDLANIMSTAMGSKAITVRQAMLIAVVFEFAGAILGGREVTSTISDGIINMGLFAQTPTVLIYGMLAVLLAGTTWMLFASFFGLPVSITNAIVGGLVGFGVLVLGAHAIYWSQVSWIALSWVASPMLAGVIAYALFRSMLRSILTTADPLLNAQRYLPIYFFIVGIVLSFMTVLKGIRHFNIVIGLEFEWLLVLGTGVALALFGLVLSKRISLAAGVDGRDRFAPVERLFSLLMAFTACAMVFAHGSNDVAIAMGPIAAIVSIVHHNGHLGRTALLPNWIMLLGCFGVVTGLFMYGRKVIATVGSGITALTPSRAFAATLAAASTVIMSTSIGIPVSATQTLVGAVLGVGLARGIGALNLNVMRNILLSWLITIPATSLLAIGYYALLKNLFSVLKL